MSGLDLVVDTNIFVYLTSGNKSVKEIVQGNNLTVSFITEMELLSWPELTSSDRNQLTKMLKQCKIINLNDDIKSLAISLRSKYRIKLPDAIVTATSQFLDMPLFSADRGFAKIKRSNFY